MDLHFTVHSRCAGRGRHTDSDDRANRVGCNRAARGAARSASTSPTARAGARGARSRAARECVEF